MNVLFNCKAATRLISKDQHQALGNQERFSLRIHLILCKYCKSFKKDMAYLKHLFDEIDADDTMCEDDKQTLRLKIAEELKMG